MDNRPGTALYHLGNQQAIQADRSQQVQVQFRQPVGVRQGRKAAAGGRGAADHMRQNVDTAHVPESGSGDSLAALGRRQIGLDKLDIVERLARAAGGCDHPGTAGPEPIDSRPPQSLGAAADEHAFASKLSRIDGRAHAVISRALMASPSRPKR